MGVSERTTLVGVVLALVGIVWAVGAGPAAALGRQAVSRIVLAPLVGLALCAALLTSAAAVMPLGVAAYAVLVPAIVLSLIAAVVLLVRRRERPAPLDVAIPLAIAVAGALIALAPGLRIGSAGPYTGALRDAWWYVAMGDWLRDHTVWDTPTDTVWLHDLMGATGWVALQVNARLGLTAVVPTVAELLGVSTDVALYPVMVLQFGLLPLALWASARAIGLGRVAAAVAALLGLGALPLSLVFDTALGNLAGLIFTPLVIAYGIRAARADGWSDIALAAIFGAALVSSYPEFVPAVIVVAVLAGAWVAWRAFRRRHLRSLRAPARRLGFVAVGVAILAPFALIRLVDYLLWADAATSSIVDRGLSPRTIGAWATGLMHPYQLGEIATLSPLMQVLLVLGPLFILALAVGGAFARRDAGDVVLVLVPIAVAVVLGLYVFRTGATDGGNCQYCLAKALTFGVPALAIGVGAGVQALVVLARTGRRVPRALAAGGLAVTAAMAVAMGVGTTHMSQTIVDTSAYVPPEARALSADGERLGVKGGVFIEGIEATGDLVYFLPALYQTVTKIPGAYPVYDGFWGAGYDLHLLANPISVGRNHPYQDYEDPDYRYVLSTYSGLDTGREVLARHGRYALERRAPVDVTVTRTEKIVGGPDRLAATAARPVMNGPVQLRVASPRAGVGHVTVTAEGPESAPRAFLATADPAVAAVVHSLGEAGPTTCFTVDLRRGFTQFDVLPAGGAATPMTFTSTRAGTGACPAPERPVVVPPAAVVGGGVSAPEPLFSGTPAQWVGTRATVDVFPNGPVRPATRRASPPGLLHPPPDRHGPLPGPRRRAADGIPRLRPSGHAGGAGPRRPRPRTPRHHQLAGRPSRGAGQSRGSAGDRDGDRNAPRGAARRTGVISRGGPPAGRTPPARPPSAR